MPAQCSWPAARACLGMVGPQGLLPNAEAAAVELLCLLILPHAPQQGSQVVQGEGDLQAEAGLQVPAAALTSLTDMLVQDKACSVVKEEATSSSMQAAGEGGMQRCKQSCTCSLCTRRQHAAPQAEGAASQTTWQPQGAG